MKACIFTQLAVIPISFAMLAIPSAATPKPITFVPPMYAASTLQVSEILFHSDIAEGKKGIYFRPLLQIGTVTLIFQLPQTSGSEDWNMRVDWEQRRPTPSTGFLITAGSNAAYFADGKFQPFPKYPGFWYDQMMVSIVAFNSFREQKQTPANSVSAIPAMRNGKLVLLEALTDPLGGCSEKWYDPKTHLLLQESLFTVEHGRTQEFERVTYSGWKMNMALPPSLFVIPPGAVQSK